MVETIKINRETEVVVIEARTEERVKEGYGYFFILKSDFDKYARGIKEIRIDVEEVAEKVGRVIEDIGVTYKTVTMGEFVGGVSRGCKDELLESPHSLESYLEEALELVFEEDSEEIMDIAWFLDYRVQESTNEWGIEV